MYDKHNMYDKHTTDLDTEMERRPRKKNDHGYVSNEKHRKTQEINRIQILGSPSIEKSRQRDVWAETCNSYRSTGLAREPSYNPT